MSPERRTKAQESAMRAQCEDKRGASRVESSQWSEELNQDRARKSQVPVSRKSKSAQGQRWRHRQPQKNLRQQQQHQGQRLCLLILVKHQLAKQSPRHCSPKLLLAIILARKSMEVHRTICHHVSQLCKQQSQGLLRLRGQRLLQQMKQEDIRDKPRSFLLDMESNRSPLKN